MRQNNDRQLPNYEQLPMQINVKIYRPASKAPSWRTPRSISTAASPSGASR